MPQYKNVHDIPESEVGNYVALGGRGILDGLKCPPSKMNVHKIEQFREDGLVLHEYGRKRRSVLPRYNFNQAAITYSPQEYKALPKW